MGGDKDPVGSESRQGPSPSGALFYEEARHWSKHTDSWTRGQKTILGGGVLSCLQSHGQPPVDAGHDCWLEIWRVNKGLVVMWRINQQTAKVGKSLLSYPMFGYFYLMSMKVIVQHTDHIFRFKSYFTHWLRCIAYSTSLPSLCLCFPTCQMGITAVPTLEWESNELLTHTNHSEQLAYSSIQKMWLTIFILWYRTCYNVNYYSYYNKKRNSLLADDKAGPQKIDNNICLKIMWKKRDTLKEGVLKYVNPRSPRLKAKI